MRLPWNHDAVTADSRSTAAGKQSERDGEAGCGFFVRGNQRAPSPSGGGVDQTGFETDHYVMRGGVEIDGNVQTST